MQVGAWPCPALLARRTWPEVDPGSSWLLTEPHLHLPGHSQALPLTRNQTAQSSPQPCPTPEPQPAPANSEALGGSPQQAPRWGVGKALEGRVLGAQEEGEDGGGARTQGVAHHNQAVVLSSAALGTERSLRARPLPARPTVSAHTGEAEGSPRSPGVVSVMRGC